MPRIARLLAPIAMLATLLAGPGQAAADKPVLAVLYFDNDTGDRTYDVLQKGFADMLITDLAGSSSVTVVERDKLQEVLGELKLQRSRYFDRRTAVKIGRGLGARYTVTGSFVALKPRVRINTRLIDVRTGKVIFGTSVTGKPSDIFELEQELVGKFLAGLKLRFDAPAMPKTRVPDVGTILEYSRAMSLADAGDYQKAQAKMKRVVSSAPSFALARVRRAELIKRYKESKERRVKGDAAAAVALLKKAESEVKQGRFIELDKTAAEHRIGYRVLRGHLLKRAFADAIYNGKRASMHYLPRTRGERRTAVAIARSWIGNQQQLLKEVKAFRTKFARTNGGSVYVPSPYARIEDADKKLLSRINLSISGSITPSSVVTELFEMAMLGEGGLHWASYSSTRLRYAPPLGITDRKLGHRVLGLLEGEWKRADAEARKPSGRSHEASRLMETWAEYFFLLGDRDQGVAKLQAAVDRYPDQAKNLERRIERELGLQSSNTHRERKKYALGLRQCDDLDIAVGKRTIVYERQRLRGWKGVTQTVGEIIDKCGGSKQGARIRERTYRDAALAAARHGYCKEFERYMKKAQASGMSRSDYAGYRKNYSDCR